MANAPIRNINPELRVKARIAAMKRGIRLGDWLNEAIATKLKREAKQK